MRRFLRRVAYRLGLIKSASFERIVKEDRNKNLADYQFAESLLAHFHHAGGLSFSLQSYKLVSLTRLLENLCPKSILELGSGSSSVIFARYQKINHGVRFVSIDESDDWLEKTEKMVQKFTPGSQVEFLCRPKIIDPSAPQAYYDCLPAEKFELVFVDGPALSLNGIEYRHIPCVDVLRMAPTNLPLYIVVDIRRPTVKAISKDLGSRYDHLKSDLLELRPKNEFRYFTVFRRRTDI